MLYLRAGATVCLGISGVVSASLFLFEGLTVSFDQLLQVGWFEARPIKGAEGRRGLVAVFTVNA